MELIVVDDASPNVEWNAVLAPFRNDPRLKVFRTSRNVGPFRIYNRLFEKIESPYIAFQDADDFCHPDRLRLQIEQLEDERADISGSWYCTVTQSGDFLELKRVPRNLDYARFRRKSFEILHGTVTLRRSVLEALGGFDGSNHTTAADTDFYLRAVFACRVRNVQRTLYSYRQHTASLTAGNRHSPERFSYETQMETRYEARRRGWWKRRFLASAPLLLRAPRNDLDFQIVPVSEPVV